MKVKPRPLAKDERIVTVNTNDTEDGPMHIDLRELSLFLVEKYNLGQKEGTKPHGCLTLKEKEAIDPDSWRMCYICRKRIHPECELKLKVVPPPLHVACSLECLLKLHPAWLDKQEELKNDDICFSSMISNKL